MQLTMLRNPLSSIEGVDPGRNLLGLLSSSVANRVGFTTAVVAVAAVTVAVVPHVGSTPSITGPGTIRNLVEGLGWLVVRLVRGDDPGLNKVRENHRAAAHSSLMHPVVLPLGDQHTAEVEDPLASRTHGWRQNRTAGVVGADWAGVDLCGERAGPEHLWRLVTTVVANVLTETHGEFGVCTRKLGLKKCVEVCSKEMRLILVER